MKMKMIENNVEEKFGANFKKNLYVSKIYQIWHPILVRS